MHFMTDTMKRKIGIIKNRRIGILSNGTMPQHIVSLLLIAVSPSLLMEVNLEYLG